MPLADPIVPLPNLFDCEEVCLEFDSLVLPLRRIIKKNSFEIFTCYWVQLKKESF